MKPPVSKPELKPTIEKVFRKLADHLENEDRIRKEMDYVQCEQGSLDEALELARKHPGREREAWEWLRNALEMLNFILIGRDLPLMRHPSYDTFMAFLVTETKKRAN